MSAVLRRALRCYLPVARIELQQTLSYPLDVVGPAVTIVLFVVVGSQLWAATFQQQAAASLAGLDHRAMAWYVMVAELVLLSQPRISTVMARAVREGEVAQVLSKPYDFVAFQLAAAAGVSVALVAVNIVAGGVTALLLGGAPPSLPGILAAATALAGAWVVIFTISALVGLCAFWIEDVSAVEWLYSKMLLVLGGLLLPLDFFPAALRVVAQSLPFSWTVYGPARLMVRPSWSGLALTLAVQFAWAAVLVMLLLLVRRRALLRVTVNGG